MNAHAWVSAVHISIMHWLKSLDFGLWVNLLAYSPGQLLIGDGDMRQVVLLTSAALCGLAFISASAQTPVPDLPVRAINTTAGAGSRIGITGFGGGAVTDGFLKHHQCALAVKECEVNVYVVPHPFGLFGGGECLIRVKDVIFLRADTEKIKWTLVMPKKKEFFFRDTDTSTGRMGIEIAANGADGDGESGKRVFEEQPLSADADVFTHHVAVPKLNRVFAYTIKLRHTFKNGLGIETTTDCAPLDPVIVNRD